MIDSGQSIDWLINQHSAAEVAFYDSKRRKKPDIMAGELLQILESRSKCTQVQGEVKAGRLYFCNYNSSINSRIFEKWVNS